jgi:hypothetical protein
VVSLRLCSGRLVGVDEQGGVAPAAGFASQGLGEMGSSHAGWAADQHILFLANPGSGGQIQHLRPVEAGVAVLTGWAKEVICRIMATRLLQQDGPDQHCAPIDDLQISVAECDSTQSAFVRWPDRQDRQNNRWPRSTGNPLFAGAIPIFRHRGRSVCAACWQSLRLDPCGPTSRRQLSGHTSELSGGPYPMDLVNPSRLAGVSSRPQSSTAKESLP